jgi:hypothetical protein
MSRYINIIAAVGVVVVSILSAATIILVQSAQEHKKECKQQKVNPVNLSDKHGCASPLSVSGSLVR